MLVGCNDEERTKSLTDILESERLQYEMKHEFEKYHKLHELALENRLLTIKNKVHCFGRNYRPLRFTREDCKGGKE